MNAKNVYLIDENLSDDISNISKGDYGKIKNLIHFIEEKKIIAVNGNFQQWSRIEFRMNDSIILVKSATKDHYLWLKNSNIYCEKLDNWWYYYIKII